MSKNLTILFIFCTIQLSLWAQVDPSKIEFEGKTRKVSYQTEREVDQVTYTIKNNGNKEVTLKLVGAFLVRGKYADPLNNGKIKTFYHGKHRKQKFLVLKPNEKLEFVVTFSPFQIYTGSQYAVRTILEIENGKRIRAEAKLDLYKQSTRDKNRFKEEEEPGK